MPCHVVRYQSRTNGATGWAVFDQDFYTIPGNFDNTRQFLENGKEIAFEIQGNLEAYQKNRIELSDIDILSPITSGGRVLCQGSNYIQSRIETGMDPDDKSFNMIFHKSDASISAPDADIARPRHVKLLDYEVELGVVIGADVRQTTDITEENLHQYVAGIVMAHDVTARDIQIPQTQYFKGKSYRSFCPVGPYLCLLEEKDFTRLHNLDLFLTVNGELKQKDNSINMLFKPYETLSELSEISDLDIGDLLLTGSPGGCALTVPPPLILKVINLLPERLKWNLFVKKQMKNPDYLKPGDQIEARISSADGVIDLGVQRNRVIEAG